MQISIAVQISLAKCTADLWLLNRIWKIIY